MSNIIQITCPNPSCNAILKISYTKDTEKKKLRCSKCGMIYPFSAFSQNLLSTQEMNPGRLEDETEIAPFPKRLETGGLLLPDEKHVTPLKMGQNIIGRKANTCIADIGVPDPQNKQTMSRSHFIIKVENQGNIIKHYLSLCAGKKNKTFVNNVEIHSDDVIILHHGDKIRIDYQTIVFVLDDEEGTVL